MNKLKLTSIIEKIRKKKIKTVLIAVALLFLVILPFISPDDFVITVFLWIFFYMILGLGWNLVGGYTGQIALAHGVFVAVGAYTTVILLVHYSITPWLALIVAPIIAGAIGLGISYPTLKLKGHYFAMVTLAFGYIVWKVLLHWEYVNGAAGLDIPYKPAEYSIVFASPLPKYYIAFALALGVIALSYIIDRSKLGIYLKAINQDEEAAENRGIAVHKYKVYAMVLSAAVTSLGGVIYTMEVLFVDPNPFFQGTLMSIRIALVAIVGGLGTLFGPIIGSFIMVPLEQYTRAFLGGYGQGYSLLLYGIVIIAIAIYWPQGIVAVIDRVKKRFQGDENESE